MRLVLALFLGVAIGFAMGLSVTKAPQPTGEGAAAGRVGPDPRAEEPAARLAGRGPPTAGRTSDVPAGASPVAASVVADAAAGDADPPPASDPHTVAWLDVSVALPPGGTRLAGTVYALPAGHPGVDDVALLSHADLDGDHARLPLPAGGLWDVGYAGPLGHTLRRDVHVAAGGETQVDLRLPAVAPLTAVFESAEAAAWAEGRNLHVQVRTDPSGPERDYPGRGDAYRWRTASHLGGRVKARTRALPLGMALELQLHYRERLPPGEATALADARPHPDWRLELSRTTAQPGDEVGVRLVRLAQVRLTPRVEGQASSSWPAGTGLHALLELRREGQVLDDAVAVVFREAQGDLDRIVLRAPEGAASLVWSGDFCFPGAVGGLHLVAGEVADVEALIRLDPEFDFEGSFVPTGERLRVRLEGAHSTDPEAELLVYAADALATGDVLGGDVRIANELDQVGEDETLVELHGAEWEGVAFVAAAHGPDRVARVAPIDPATGEVRLRLSPLATSWRARPGGRRNAWDGCSSDRKTGDPC